MCRIYLGILMEMSVYQVVKSKSKIEVKYIKTIFYLDNTELYGYYCS